MKFVSCICQVFLIIGLYTIYVNGSCPDGYCRHSNGCYLVVGLNVTWIEARSYCTVLGGSLLSIKTSEEQTTTEGALRRSKGIVYPGRFWLDFTDLLNPKDWKRMADKQALTYTNWRLDDNKNVTQSENCVEMQESTDYEWSTVSCTENLNFVCYATGISASRTRQYNYNRGRYYYDDEDDDDDVEC